MNNDVFNQAVKHLAEPIQAQMHQAFAQHPFSGQIPASIMAQLLPAQLPSLLPFAACFAVTPVSDFNVGALVVGNSGAGYIGANLEFAGQALGQSVHAEQAAINNAWLAQETGIKQLFVNASPCGHCRQFIREVAGQEALTVQVLSQPDRPFAELLPDSFGPQDLGNQQALFQQPTQCFVAVDEPNGEPVGEPIGSPAQYQAIIAEANLSYAPYTGYYHSLGLQTHDEQWFIGRYSENAAYNPSLPALQSALSQLRFAGYGLGDVKTAVLAHRVGQKIDMTNQYKTLLTQLNQLELTVIKLN
ncbi:cytidine deaminase [Motilimonas eburnea]|uniref:cytidine deaminase n=1 Tax=Motilimonas eburnea TaxID=1737488 RepID=UPI001E408CE3|nr:cytidine deaminase [Motilimonas eburnea]MCE2571975.1 cytidine deaminase [Motilimonas eburnea]